MKLTNILVVWGAALALVTSAHAQSTPVHGAGQGQAISQNQIQSSGHVRLGRNEYDVTSTVTILSLGQGNGHTLVGQTSHTVDFGNGDTFTTMDTVQLVPVDNAGTYQLLIKCDVVSGTGAFANSTGNLTFTGRVNLATGQAEWRLNGQLR